MHKWISYFLVLKNVALQNIFKYFKFEFFLSITYKDTNNFFDSFSINILFDWDILFRINSKCKIIAINFLNIIIVIFIVLMIEYDSLIIFSQSVHGWLLADLEFMSLRKWVYILILRLFFHFLVFFIIFLLFILRI